MTRITFYENRHHEYEGFDVFGHSDYADSGEDIVCAAISMLVINTMNSIEKFTSDETSYVSDEEDGIISFRFSQTPSHDAQLLVRSMILGLESLEDDADYEPYIDIIFEEV